MLSKFNGQFRIYPFIGHIVAHELGHLFYTLETIEEMMPSTKDER